MLKSKKSHYIKIQLLLILFLTTIFCNEITPVSRTKIFDNWQLRIDYCPKPQYINLTFNATVPSVLHLDLLKFKKIQDPFFGTNHKKMQWISSCNVTYSKNLTFQSSTNQTYQLVFEGIDTYSTVVFNGKEILKTENAFVQYRVKLNNSDIKFGKDNLLQVHIYSTKPFEQKSQKARNMPSIYAHTRKAAYQYSWDWAPNLNTMGLWKLVYLQSYSHVIIDYIWVRTRQITKSKAILNFAIALRNQSNINNDQYLIQIISNSNILAQSKVNQIYNYIDIDIINPKLWWPNGIGQPNLYDFLIKLVRSGTSQQIDIKSVLYGIRTVSLDTSNKKFTILLNGHKIYCKGSNYVPPDMFYPRMTNPDYTPAYTYRQLLNDAVQSHFNMLRVWGGGQYQSNQFFDLASKKGIMIFYDFMFSDSIYPSHKQMLKNIEIQVTQQIRRVRNYPCIVLWNGNNQIFQGIKKWGWSRGTYPKDYKTIFQLTIPAIMKKQNIQIPYIPTSPLNGIGNNGFEEGGDIHYWGVWAGGALFEAYARAIGPFNSQFGTQGIPVWQTVLNFTSPQSRSYQSEEFLSHQKHNSKFNTLRKYHKIYAHQPINFQQQVYLSGLIQAYGIQIAIKYQRASKPQSYGTLYWQFNDAWPAISWSSIDYFGRWKPLQYMVKRLYHDVAIFYINKKLIVINDNLYPINCVAVVKIQNFNGTLQNNRTYELSLQPNQVKQLDELKIQSYSNKLKHIVLHMEVIAGRFMQMVNTHFFVYYKQLQLDPSAKLFVKIVQKNNLLLLNTDKFIKNLYISSSKQYLKLSDNYFDMIAGKNYKIKLDNRHRLTELKDTLQFRTYIQIYKSQVKLDVIYQQIK